MTGGKVIVTQAYVFDRTAYDELMKVVRRRRSVRSFEPGHRVPREILEMILDTCRWAPSGANTQPWDFICVDDP